METKLISYKDGDHELQGLLAFDPKISGPRPTVLVFHDWSGRNEFACDRAKDLAKLGYTGFAVDLYGKGIIGSNPEENMKLIKPFLQDRTGLLLRRMKLALHTIQWEKMVDSEKVAAIGYCFGGLCALDIARSGEMNVKGVVSFHGLLTPIPGVTILVQGAPKTLSNPDLTPVKSKVLVLHGHDDPSVKPNQVVEFAEEMTKRNADWQIHSYGHTCHSFTKPYANDPANGQQYSPVATARSWLAMKNFLEEVFE